MGENFFYGVEQSKKSHIRNYTNGEQLLKGTCKNVTKKKHLIKRFYKFLGKSRFPIYSQ